MILLLWLSVPHLSNHQTKFFRNSAFWCVTKPSRKLLFGLGVWEEPFSGNESLRTHLWPPFRCSAAQREKAIGTLLYGCGKGRLLCWLYYKILKLSGFRQHPWFSPPQTAVYTQSQKSQQTLKLTSLYPVIVSLRAWDHRYYCKRADLKKWGEETWRYRATSLTMKLKHGWISTDMIIQLTESLSSCKMMSANSSGCLHFSTQDPVAVGGASEQLRDVPAIVWCRLPWYDHDQSTDIFKDVRANDSTKTVFVLCVDSPESMRNLSHLIDLKDDFYRNKGVFVKLLTCHLLTPSWELFRFLRRDRSHLHWSHLFSIRDRTPRRISDKDVNINVTFKFDASSERATFTIWRLSHT